MQKKLITRHIKPITLGDGDVVMLVYYRGAR
ncbi:MAG: hypothetical protein ACI93H_001307 [Psychromonas sp.]|jgi:hypothetical protein